MKKTLQLKVGPNETKEELLARIYVNGLLNCTNIVMQFNPPQDDITVTDIWIAILEKTKEIKENDLKSVETMLTAQAIALDSIFGHLVSRSFKNLGEYINASETYMKLALKAQSQCRTTLETLAMIKNPQPYVKQQNVAYNQQVNNGEKHDPHARENIKSTNELLEDKINDEQWLDTGTTPKTGSINTELEAVGT